jgi:short-subunit dehydrogenase
MRTIVITGASSGMGRAAALAFSQLGDNVVVAARRGDVLDGLALECGERSLAVPTDVADEHAVEELAQQAVAQFGHIDAWVHTAAVASFGTFWETPVATMRRLVEVDLVGSMIVAREALRQFIKQGEGTLVLVSSVLGKTPIPYLNVYTAAKHGVVGLATSIRADLKEAGLHERIKVVNLMPPSTDTPFYDHAANYVGLAPRPPPPAYAVDTLAQAIVEAVDAPEDDITVGAMGKLMRAAHGAAPGLYESLSGPYSRSMFFDREVPRTDGSVFRPTPGGTTPEGPLGKRKEVST